MSGNRAPTDITDKNPAPTVAEKSSSLKRLNLQNLKSSTSPKHSPRAELPNTRPRSSSLKGSPRLFFNPHLDMLPVERKNKAKECLPEFIKEMKTHPQHKIFLEKFYSYPLTATKEKELEDDFVLFAENKMEDLLIVSRALTNLETTSDTLLENDKRSDSPTVKSEYNNSPRVLRRYSINGSALPSIINLFKDKVAESERLGCKPCM